MWFKDFCTKTLSIEPFVLIWLTDGNPSFQFDSKNWTLFKKLLKELNPFQHMTRRIEHFFHSNFYNMTQKNEFFNMFWRVEPFFDMTWRIDFSGKTSQTFEPFLNMTKELKSYFLNMTQGIEPLISWIWRNEWDRLIFEYDSKKWTFLHKTQRIEIIFEWLKELNFFRWLKEWNFCEKKRPWLREMNYFFRYHSKNWTLKKPKLWFKELNFI